MPTVSSGTQRTVADMLPQIERGQNIVGAWQENKKDVVYAHEALFSLQIFSACRVPSQRIYLKGNKHLGNERKFTGYVEELQEMEVVPSE